jgi:hypothetical protein
MRKYDLTINNNSYEVIVKKVTDNEALVEVNGQEHTVAINQIQRLVLPESVPKPPAQQVPGPKVASPTARSTTVSGDGVIAPMPGQINAILVREGPEQFSADACHGPQCSRGHRLSNCCGCIVVCPGAVLTFCSFFTACLLASFQYTNILP